MKVNQKSKECIIRELMKAYTGFSSCDEAEQIVTGNWGCGIFGGDIKVKFIIQWLAASMAGKNIIFCPFGK
jgi:poly(ADP-ribose) glycohydrolase